MLKTPWVGLPDASPLAPIMTELTDGPSGKRRPCCVVSSALLLALDSCKSATASLAVPREVTAQKLRQLDLPRHAWHMSKSRLWIYPTIVMSTVSPLLNPPVPSFSTPNDCDEVTSTRHLRRNGHQSQWSRLDLHGQLG